MRNVQKDAPLSNEIKVILSVCSSKFNPYHSIGQNWLYKALAIEKLSARIIGALRQGSGEQSGKLRVF